MDVIYFIMYKENCTKAEAIQKAIALCGDTTTSGEAAEPPVKPSIPQRAVFTKHVHLL
jgi:hypothetical protein